ncbi:MAG TPA: cation:proton antiporter [Stellaceae bacterium]|nr:cation:proton antiporter [Stellaceae bacterium]
MLDTALVLLVIAGLLVIVGVCRPLAVRLRLPTSVLLAGIGVGIGAAPTVTAQLGLARPVDTAATLFAGLPVSATMLLYVFLPLLVFEAGIVTDVRRTLEDAAAILVLAVIVTVLTMAAIGFALWPFAGLPLAVCLLLGAIVATTDPAAVIAVFRDVGAPARLARLVEGEALLNDAAAIALFVVLLNMILAGGSPDIAWGLGEFAVSFAGGGAVGFVLGRVLLWIMPHLGDDRLAEATLSVAFAYLAFIIAQHFLDLSGIVAVLAASLTTAAFGQARIAPDNWTFLVDLWEQIAFWSRSLIFILAAMLVPRLLTAIGGRDLVLLGVLIAAAFGARIFALFVLVPPLEHLRLTERVDCSYKLAIVWGGLRGALTLVLALAVTENPAIPPAVQRFVAVLATGFVLFTLFVNGTTLRLMIRLLGLNLLAPRDLALRDRILALSRAEAREAASEIARTHEMSPAIVDRVVALYGPGGIATEPPAPEIDGLSERDRLAIALVALANQERLVALEMRRDRIAAPAAIQIVLGNADALAEAARRDGRLGYRRASERALVLSAAFRLAYFLYRRLGIVRLLAERLADRVERLLLMRFVIERLVGFNDRQIAPLFGLRIAGICRSIIDTRRRAVAGAFDALRRQYPDYVAELEARFLRQSALRREMTRFQSLYEEGLIPREIYEDLRRGIDGRRAAAPRPRLDIGLDTHRLVHHLDLLAGLDEEQLDRVCRLLRPRLAVPNEVIIRRGERGDAVFFIASGAVEVRFAARQLRLGTGEFFGEMALLSGRPRQADVVALTYCQLLMLRQADFAHFIAANPAAREAIEKVAAARQAMNAATESA